MGNSLGAGAQPESFAAPEKSAAANSSLPYKLFELSRSSPSITHEYRLETRHVHCSRRSRAAKWRGHASSVDNNKRRGEKMRSGTRALLARFNSSNPVGPDRGTHDATRWSRVICLVVAVFFALPFGAGSAYAGDETRELSAAKL